MLQLTENTRALHAQIAKKFRNGCAPFCSISCRAGSSKNSGREHINCSPNWSFARLDATLLPALSARDIRHRLRARGKR